VKNTATADVTKLVAYVVACFLFAALLSPPLFKIGKGFAEATINRDTAENITWLAQKAQKAEFETYFKRALMLSALVLLPPLLFSLKLRVDPRKLNKSRWSIYLPSVVRDQNIGQPLLRNHSRFRHLTLGFLLSGSVLFLMATVLFKLGFFGFDKEPNSENILYAIKRALAPTFITATIEEVLFRGALLGIFLRAFRPKVAILTLSILFAAVHFLQPPSDVQVSHPGSWKSGFEMLGLIGAQLMKPQAMLYEFTTLLLVGLILGHARYGTASLWLPIGLHAGWIFSFKVFKKLCERTPDLPEKYDIYIGETLTQGLIPLLALLLTWGILYPVIGEQKEEVPPDD